MPLSLLPKRFEQVCMHNSLLMIFVLFFLSNLRWSQNSSVIIDILRQKKKRDPIKFFLVKLYCALSGVAPAFAFVRVSGAPARAGAEADAASLPSSCAPRTPRRCFCCCFRRCFSSKIEETKRHDSCACPPSSVFTRSRSYDTSI